MPFEDCMVPLEDFMAPLEDCMAHEGELRNTSRHAKSSHVIRGRSSAAHLLEAAAVLAAGAAS